MYWLFIIVFIVFLVFARDYSQSSITSYGLLIAFGTLPIRHSKKLKSKTSVKLVCEDLDLGS